MRFLYFLVFTAFFLFGVTATANTVLGGNITWTCLVGDQYRIKLTTYLDCYGYDLVNGVPSSESVMFVPSGSGCTSSPFSFNLAHTGHTQISDLCPTEMPFSSCSGGANQGVMQFTYEGNVTLSPGCTWTVAWINLYWGYFINSNEFSNPAYIHSEINTTFPCAASPTIASTPSAPQVPYMCVGITETHQVVLNNLPPGHTVDYTILENLVAGSSFTASPSGANGWAPIPGLSAPNPAAGSGGTEITWTTPPSSNLTTNGFRLRIRIYDASGNHVGTINENMVFYLRDCTVTNTQFNTPPVTSVGPQTTLTGGNNVSVCAGDSLIFTVAATNPNPLRAITINHTTTPTLPWSMAQQTGTNPANKTFKILTTGAQAGNYTLNLNAIDDQCPNPDTDAATVNITIHPNVQLTFSDTTICHGNTITLTAQGLSNNAYTWSVIDGDSNFNPTANSATQTVTPNQTTRYRVVGTAIPASCQAADTVIVRVLMAGLTFTKTDETCNNTNGSINLTLTGAPSSNITYTWTGAGAIQNQQNQNNLNSGTYSVVVNETVYGCSLSQSITIADIPAPTLSFTGTTTICEGDCATLSFLLTQGTAPFNVTGTGSIFPYSSLTASGTVSVCPTTTTTYTATGVTDASGCPATINQSVTVTVRPRVTGTFTGTTPLCLGDNLGLNVTFAPAGNYTLFYSYDSPSAPDTQQPAVSNIPSGPVTGYPNPTMVGTHIYDIDSIRYNNAPFCASSDASNPSFSVVVNPKPTATLTGTTTVCAGGCTNLILNLTGTAPWVVRYRIGAGALQTLNVASSPYTWNVCPTATSTYCIEEITDANCTTTGITGVCATVTVAPEVSNINYTLSSANICEGDQATLSVSFTPAPPTEVCLYFHTNSSEAAFATPTFCNQTTPFTINATPTQTSNYCLDSIHVVGFPQCATVYNQCRTVTVHGGISVVPTDTICNSINTQYRVVYTLSGGTAPYTEAAAVPNGSMVGNTFTTDFVNNGAAGPWTFTDTYDCIPFNINTNYTCPVQTNPGTMGTTAINICGNGAATGIHGANEFLDGNDELMFILYTDINNPQTSYIQTNCSAPVFSFNGSLPMTYGVTYYIGAVAGDAGTPGCVNINPPNTYASNGTPVTWYQTPTATLSAPGSTSACSGSCVTLNITLTGQGPWTVSYNINGGNTLSLPIPVNAPNPYPWCVDASGTYLLTGVSSGAGPTPCIGNASGSVAVTINPLPTATISGVGNTCTNINHCFDITFPTGTGPFDIVIDHPSLPDFPDYNIPSTPSPYQGYCSAAAGSYRILSVTDDNGCVSSGPSAPFTLIVNALPVVLWTFGDTTFCEGSSIDLHYAISLGLAPYNIDYDALPDPTVTDPAPGSPATGSITVDEEGPYRILSVTDANGCMSGPSAIINLTEIDAPIADAGPDMNQCLGVPLIIGTPQEPNHTYTWSPATPGISPGPTNIPQPTVNITTAGVTQQYVVHAHVAQCTSTDTVLVTTHALPTFQIIASADSLCNGDCADITATTIGNGTLSYLWTASPSIADPTINPVNVCLTADETFTATASEVHGSATCVSTQNISIEVGAPINVAEDFTDQICFGTCIGEIHLVASGGFAPHTFDVASDITSWSTTGLCPGTYDYIVLDAIGCSFTGSIVIAERPQEVISLIDITQPTCAYDLGRIQVNNPYTSYTIASGAGCPSYTPNPSSLTSGIFENVPPCATEYTISATFQVSPTESCSTSALVLIEPDSDEIILTADTWSDNIFCYNEQACFDGTVTGGSGTPDITWHTCSDANCLETSTAEPYCVPMTQDITLYGVATDDNNCRSNIIMLSALLTPDITLNVQNGLDSVAICEYDCVDLTSVVTGGSNPVIVDWYILGGPVPIGQGTINVCPLDTLTYYAIAHDGCSQEVSDTLVVIVHDTPEVLIDADIYEGCYPQTINFVDLSNAVADNHTCVWNFGAGAPQSVCGDITFTYPNYGVFRPTYTITTEYGCIGKDTLDNTITIYGKPQMGFNWKPQPITVIENRLQLVNQTIAAVSYKWEVYGIGTSVEANPKFILPPRDNSTFEVCLEATTVHGCKDTLCQDVFMETLLQVFVPNSFTPDFGDENEINDVFLPIITGHNPDKYNLWITNRWGDIVFHTTDHTKAWTGNFGDGETYVQDGTYVWQIECFELNSTQPQVFQGTVTILR